MTKISGNNMGHNTSFLTFFGGLMLAFWSWFTSMFGHLLSAIINVSLQDVGSVVGVVGVVVGITVTLRKERRDAQLHAKRMQRIDEMTVEELVTT